MKSLTTKKTKKMKKYPTPKAFNPTPEEEKRVALELSKLFSPNIAIVTKSGEEIQGTRNH